ncbi:hypothetical protein AXF42_Ash013301 [Apostasia shenzhenica]|uniref:Uncharacterized protein n=1 Tax=Apostasia shenzhenica TaxID=1088818 RepID=A0A2I0BBL3_9ASPA|nr:hypothetical protein AXF42_Ash013301 [Apostasia shenzhenica]
MTTLFHLPHNFLLHGHESFLKSKLTKVQGLGYSGPQIPSGGLSSACAQSLTNLHGNRAKLKLVSVRVASDDTGNRSDDENSDRDEASQSENDEVPGPLSREDLERIVGQDDSTFSGVDLATLIRKKYGRSYDVQLIKKEFMGRNLLAMNVMWKYMEQRSFPLTEDEYILRLDDVANTLKCWGAVSHVRNSLAKLRERPRIGKVFL